MNRVVSGYQVGSYSVRKQQAFTKIDFLKTRLIFKLLILGAFVVFLSLFYIWSRVQIVSLGYQINELKKVQADLKNNNKLLQMELALLKSPTRLQQIASEKLQMKIPSQDRIIEIE
jgi:cell division protein FtsL